MLTFSLLDARQSECELRFIAEAGVARDLKPRPGGSAIEHHAERALVGDSQRGDRRLAADVEGAASARNRKPRSEEHTSELQSLMRNSYAVFCLKKKKINKTMQ